MVERCNEGPTQEGELGINDVHFIHRDLPVVTRNRDEARTDDSLRSLTLRMTNAWLLLDFAARLV